jgi:hypothetical protein
MVNPDGPSILPGVLLLVLVGWLPTALLAAREAIATGAWPAVALAFETHVRYLVTGPLFLLGNSAVHERVLRSIEELVAGGFIRTHEVERFRSDVLRFHRLGKSTTSTALCFAVALATTAVNPVDAGTDPAGRWEGSVGLTLFRFVLLLVVWRWALWAIFLAWVSRFDLALVATHPDLGGGLGFLTQPSEVFSVIVLGAASLVAARWSTDVFRNGVPFLSFRPELSTFAALMTVLGILPLLPFTVRLFRLRIVGLREYGRFARDYCARFEAKWIRRPAGEAPPNPLGTPDLQSLSDLANSFGVVARSRPFLVTPRLAATLAIAAVVPMIPLFMSVVPLEVIVPRLVRLL